MAGKALNMASTIYGSPDPLRNKMIYPAYTPVMIHGGGPPPVPPPEDKTTIEKLLTEIHLLQRECIRLNDEIKRWRFRAILSKEHYTEEDQNILNHWLAHLARTRPPPLKRAAPASEKSVSHTVGRLVGERPSETVPGVIVEPLTEATRSVEQDIGTPCERSLDEMIEEQLQKERELKRKGIKTASRRMPSRPQTGTFMSPNGPQYFEELPLSPLLAVPPPTEPRIDCRIFPAQDKNQNPAGQSIGVLGMFPENDVQNKLFDMIGDTPQESLKFLARDRRHIPPPVKRVAAAREVVPQCPEAPPGRNRRRGIENARGFQLEQQLQPLRRVSILGLCTTAEVDALAMNEQLQLKDRLQKILLKRTTEGTMNHISDSKVKGVPPLQHLSELFECSTLDAFDYAGLDLSARLRVSATMRSSLREGEMVIAGDKDVNALLWMKELLEDTTLDEVSRREIILYRNNIRWRMVGLPLSPIWVRELIWRTLMTTILYIENIHG